jgi:ABC-type lipoprotein release transport system permease subunit
VFVSLVVITVLSGLASQFKGKVHSFVGDCAVSSGSLLGFDGYEEFADVLRSQGFVEAVAPVIRAPSLVKARSSLGETGEFPCEVVGIDPNEHFAVTGLAGSLTWHSAEPRQAFTVPYDLSAPGCMAAIGILLERDEHGRYYVPPEVPPVAFEVTALPLTARGTPARAGADLVSSKTFWLSDAVNSGLARVDWSTMYLPFEQAQMLFGMNLGAKRATALFVRFRADTDGDAACVETEKLWNAYLARQTRPSDLMKQVKVQSWRMYQREMVAAVENEQRMMSVIFALLGAIAVFIVFVVFYMIISHKSKDIGILKSLGASTGDVAGTFLCFGLLVGAAGAALGTLAAWRFLVHINEMESLLLRWFHFQLWNRRMFAINEIPNTIYPEVLLVIVASAILTSLLGALIPSIQGARKRPVDSLQVSQL